MIGLSLSFCVRDIARRGLNVDDIDKIITSTKCATDADWREVIEGYQKTHWSGFPKETEAIVYRLLRQGKIVQPRLKDNRHFPMLGTTGFWVESENQIEWNNAFTLVDL